MTLDLPHRLASLVAASPLRSLARAIANMRVTEHNRIRETKLIGHGRGLRMRLDFKAQKSYAYGVYEPAATERLLGTTRRGDCVWDVGAHVGYFTLLLARATGPEGKVVAFEPMPQNRALLEENVTMNALRQVSVLPYALGDHNGKTPLYHVGETVLPAASTVVAPEATSHGFAEAQMRAGDDLVAEGVPPPSVMKIDVEGAEALVLEGLRRTIAHHRPVILVELHDRRFGEEARRARSILRELGYTRVETISDSTHRRAHLFATG